MGSVTVNGIASDFIDESFRASARVSGETIWCESPQLSLRAGAEAFASLLVIPCLLQGLDLELLSPVCSTWYSNVCKVSEMLSDSWGIPLKLPKISKLIDPVDNRQPARAQFFSGGVDSFYALLTAKLPVQYLVSVHGFDIALNELVRFDHLTKTVNEVAAAVDAKPCLIRTNIREHPVVNAISWEDAHGGALAAVGHLLAPHIGSIVIPPSWGEGAWHSLWGSHWAIDPLWSSAELGVIHGDATLSRSQRIMAIAKEPLVQRNLRVCYENLSPFGNCSQCEKCVRSMTVLHVIGELHKFSVFDQSMPIWERIDNVPHVRLTITYDELLKNGVEPRLEAAIKRLIKRSRTALAVAEYKNQVLEKQVRSLLKINKEHELELRRLQAEVAAMADSRVWKAGNVLRGYRDAILPKRK